MEQNKGRKDSHFSIGQSFLEKDYYQGLEAITEESFSLSPNSKVPSPALQYSTEGDVVSDQKCFKTSNLQKVKSQQAIPKVPSYSLFQLAMVKEQSSKILDEYHSEIDDILLESPNKLDQNNLILGNEESGENQHPFLFLQNLKAGHILESYTPEYEQLKSGGPQMVEQESNLAPYCHRHVDDWSHTNSQIKNIKMRQLKERDRSSSSSGRIKSREITTEIRSSRSKRSGPKVLEFNRTPDKKRKEKTIKLDGVKRGRIFSADDVELAKRFDNAQLQPKTHRVYNQVPPIDLSAKKLPFAILGADEPDDTFQEIPIAVLKEVPQSADLKELPVQVKIAANISKPLLQFNVLVMGEAGIGKSAFIEHLLMELNKSAATALLQQYLKSPSKTEGFLSQPTAKITTFPIKTDTMKVQLIDCPGHRTGFEGSLFEDDIVKFIETKLLQYNNKQTEIKEAEKDPVICQKLLSKARDDRVHLILYFFQGGYGVKPYDLKVISKIQTLANVIPVVAKADSFTKESLKDFKRLIVQNAQKHQIHFFNCRESLDCSSDLLKNCPPFAIVTPTDFKSGRRERIDGWTDCNFYEFKHMFQILFKELPQKLLETTDFHTREYFTQRQKTEKQEREKKLLDQTRRQKLATLMSAASIGIGGLATLFSRPFY